MTETEDKKHIFLQIVYIVILAASAMGDMPDFSFAMTRVMKALSILIVVIGAVILFVSGNLDRVKTCLLYTSYRQQRSFSYYKS